MHESPKVMLIPLYVLAVGALVAGFVFKDYFIGHEFERLLAWLPSPTNEIMHEMHDVPGWVVWSPFVAMVLGFALAFLFYIRNTVAARRSSPPSMSRSTSSCSTSGTSTNSTT